MTCFRYAFTPTRWKHSVDHQCCRGDLWAAARQPREPTRLIRDDTPEAGHVMLAAELSGRIAAARAGRQQDNRNP